MLKLLFIIALLFPLNAFADNNPASLTSVKPVNGIYLSSANALGFVTSSSTAITITNAGLVGIGTTVPADSLDISSSLGIVTTTATKPTTGIYSPSINSLAIVTSGNTAVTVLLPQLTTGNSGFVGIGTATPGAPLHIFSPTGSSTNNSNTGPYNQATFVVQSTAFYGTSFEIDSSLLAGGDQFQFSSGDNNSSAAHSFTICSNTSATCPFWISAASHLISTGASYLYCWSSISLYGQSTCDTGLSRDNGTAATVDVGNGGLFDKSGRLNAATVSATTQLLLSKVTTAPASPGAGSCSLYLMAGTTTGTAKMNALCGTTTVPFTVFDNAGGGF